MKWEGLTKFEQDLVIVLTLVFPLEMEAARRSRMKKMKKVKGRI
jgi:hypothetical protein